MSTSPDTDPADALDQMRDATPTDEPDTSPGSATLQAPVPAADVTDVLEQQTSAWGGGSRPVVEPDLEADPADAAEQATELPRIGDEDERDEDRQDRRY